LFPYWPIIKCLDAVKKLEDLEKEAKKEKEEREIIASQKEDLEDLLKAKQRLVAL
jgi:hypothetical protein